MQRNVIEYCDRELGYSIAEMEDITLIAIMYIIASLHTMYYIIYWRRYMALSATVTFRTTPELKARVDDLAKRTKRSSGFYYNILLEDYLDDLEDIYDAIQISENIRSGKEKTYYLDEVAKELGYEG